MKRAMYLSILLSLVALLLGLTGCGNDGETSKSTSDADSDTDTDADSDGDTDSDSDSDPIVTECDGADLDCYKDCWGCAESSDTCKPMVEDCMSDEICAAYYQCKLEDCCDEENNCLTGDDWESCMGNCSEQANLTVEAYSLYAAIDKCVACDACAISCGQNEKDDFAMCAEPDQINSVDNPCYDEDATDDEVACFSWAGWGGPCSWAVKQCKANEACAQLEEDINATWDFDDWSARQDELWQNTSKEVEGLYWAYMQCIYCSACDVACLTDAGSKHCTEYDPDDPTQLFSDANTAEEGD